MNSYVTQKIIRDLREKKGLTQLQLAEMINVSDKTISKWETGKGLPDISLIEPLSKALGVSIVELFQGEIVSNENKCANILKGHFYVCPICGNNIHSMGDCIVSCCGIQLPSLESEEAIDNHAISIEYVENDLFVTLNHPMTKTHYISFIAYVTTSKVQIIKLYPEGNCEARFENIGRGDIYCYCNKDGLFKKKM